MPEAQNRRQRWRSYRRMYWDLRGEGCPSERAALLATGAWCYWPLRLLFPSADDPVERALHGATIIDRDEETGLVVRTHDGRIYGLSFDRRGGTDILGVIALADEPEEAPEKERSI